MRPIILTALLLASAAASAQVPDPARLAVAQRIIAAQMPPGAMARMMDGVMGNVTTSMTRQISAMSTRQLAAAAGAPPEQVAKLGEGTLGEAMAILDPAFEARMERTMRVMLAGMKPIIAEMEPNYRRAFAELYARRFDADTLAAVDAFYRTPAGARFAAESMTLAADPAVAEAMADFQPKLLAALPGIMRQAEAATADLPKPRKPEDLSPAERAKLRALLGAAGDRK